MLVAVIALVLLAISLAGGCLVGASLCRYAGTDYHPCDSLKPFSMGAAPYDDEPLSEAEARELDAARAEVERGEVVSHEEVRRLWLK